MATFNGTSGDDVYLGTAEGDTIKGNAGNDTLRGDAGDDVVNGGAGNDELAGGLGRDTLIGGDGDDVLYIQYTDETVAGEVFDGGAGIDTLDVYYGGDISALELISVERVQAWNQETLLMTGDQFASFGYIQAENVTLTTAGLVRLRAGGVVETATQITLHADGNTLDLRAGSSGTPGMFVTGVVIGSASADTVLAGSGPVMLEGNGGNDRLTGSSGDDSLSGGDGDDVLAGGDGDDDVIGGAGLDDLSGGGGADVFWINDPSEFGAGESYDGGKGIDRLELNFTAAADISGIVLRGIEELECVSTSLSLTAAQLDGLSRTQIYAGTVTLTSGGTVSMGSGFYYTGSTINLNAAGNKLDLGHTSWYGTVNGAAGADRVVVAGNGFLGSNLHGNGGDDTLIGGSQHDTLNGGVGNDVLDGGGEWDTMVGGAGNDLYFVGGANDMVIELAGEGIDRVNATVSHTLWNNVENLVLRGDQLDGTGNALDNAMQGSSGKNTLAGLDGADTLNGGAGFDTLDGGTGSDFLTGGFGKDRLTGGTGLDQFAFADGDTSADHALADIVTDFSHAQGDRIKLSAVDANTTLAGDQKFAFIGTGAFTHVAGQLHYVQDAGNTFVEGDTNGDGLADFSIRLSGLVGLVAGDFVL